MKALVTAALGASLALLVTVRPAAAVGVDPERIPADAKVVIHLDFQALQETTLVSMVREKHGHGITAARAWMIDKVGMDIREDVRGITFFTNTYEPEVGAMVLDASFDQEKVEALIEEEGDAETREWRGHTLYIMEKKDKPGETFVLALLDGESAVFASSVRQARRAIRVLEGRGESLADTDSGLIVDAPEGTVLYAAARDLDEIECELPIIQQHTRIVYLVGESDDEVFDQVMLEGEDEGVARNMHHVVNGFVSLVALWADDSDEIMQLVEDTEVTREGNVVTKAYRGSTESLIAAMEVIHERCGHHHGWHHHHGEPRRDCGCSRGDCECERGESSGDCDCEEGECDCPRGHRHSHDDDDDHDHDHDD